MPKRKRKTPKSQSPRSRSSADRLESLLDPVYDLLEKDQPFQALELLEKIPRRYQHQPEYLYVRGSVHQQVDNLSAALQDLEAAVRKAPYLYEAYLDLAVVYADLEYLGHAAQAAEKFLNSQPADRGRVELAQAVLKYTQQAITDKAERTGFSREKFAPATFMNENVQLSIALGEYKQAVRQANEAMHLLPDWAPPHNNKALAQYYLGNLDQAILEEKTVLQSIDAHNVQALGNLILFHLCLWQRDQAAQYADRLHDIVLNNPLEGIDLSKAIESLGFWEDDQALWDIASRLIGKPKNSLGGGDWYILGAAAANTGHLPEAERLFKRAARLSGSPLLWVEESLKAVRSARRHKEIPAGPSVSGRFPYIHFAQVWPLRSAEHFYERMTQFDDPEKARRYLEKYTADHLDIVAAARLIFWNEKNEMLWKTALEILSATHNPGAYQEIRNFAISQYGSDEQRMGAWSELRNAGQFIPDEIVPFWSAEDQEWREIRLFSSQIENEYIPPCSQATVELIDKSLDILSRGPNDPGNQSEAIPYLEKAVEIEPDCAMALHNLGALYMNLGKLEEGEALIRRSVAVDPNYLFAFTTLAQLELRNKNFEACKDHIEHILSSSPVPFNVIQRTFEIQVRLGVAEQNLKGARTALQALKEFSPDDPELLELEALLMLSETGGGWHDRWLEDAHRYRDRQMRKPISAQEKLVDCLDRITREALATTLRYWGLYRAGKKAEVISRLVESMTHLHTLSWFIEKELSQDEKEALAWVLEGGGIRPWVAFTDRFEDDYDESPHWQYHDPETIPGRLRMLGFLAVGTLEDERVALIPADLRHLLVTVLKKKI